MSNFVIKLFGICAFIVMALSYQMKGKKGLLFLQFISYTLLLIESVLLGSFIMVAVFGINIVRAIACFAEESKEEKNKKIFFSFLLIVLVAGFLTWNGAASIFSIIASLIFTFALFSKNTSTMRKFFLMASMASVVSGILGGSLWGILKELAYVVSIIFAIVRFDNKKIEETPEPSNPENV